MTAANEKTRMPSKRTVEALSKLERTSPPAVPKAVELKIQPRQTVKLPGGGFAVVPTKTWW